MIAAFLQLPGLPRSTEESAFSLRCCGRNVSSLSPFHYYIIIIQRVLIAHHSPGLTPALPTGSLGPSALQKSRLGH